VNQESEGGTSSWCVAYQRFDNALTSDDWDVMTNIVSSTGVIKGAFFQGPASSTPAHKIRPQVSGRAGRYVVTYLLSGSPTSDLGQGIYAQRFDWADAAATPTKIAIRTIASDNVTQNFVNGGVAYDNVKDSFWGVVYQRGGYTVGRVFAARLGHTGGVVEAVTSYSGPSGGYSPSISFNDDGSKFLLVYGSTDNPPSGYPVYAQEFTYFSTATNTVYGTGCGGTIGASTPWSGYEFFTVNLTGAAATMPCALLIGSGAAAISLAPAGMPGCFLNVTPILVSLNTLTNGAGAASIPIPIPDFPAAIGDVFFQFLYADPGAPWALKVRTTSGLRSSVH
jgi:hypothetical protein